MYVLYALHEYTHAEAAALSLARYGNGEYSRILADAGIGTNTDLSEQVDPVCVQKRRNASAAAAVFAVPEYGSRTAA